MRFRSNVARDISMQQWHPKQIAEWERDEYILSVPYSNDQELIQDIMRHIPDVIVEAPTELRNAVTARLEAGLKQYSQNKN